MELAQILRSIRKKKKFIILEGNRIIDLDRRWQNEDPGMQRGEHFPEIQTL